MNVAVLAGGQGSRLGYAGQKCCVPVAGKPFLHWKLDELVIHGASVLHILISHEPAEVISVVSAWKGHLSLPINYIYDDGLGPWTAVSQAAEYIPERTFWVANGDVLCPTPLYREATPTRLVTRNHPTEDPNLGDLLDAGFYHVSRTNPSPSFWIDREIPNRTYTINTREQLEETDAFVRRYRVDH